MSEPKKNPRQELTSGEFYFGAPCPNCGTFQYLIYDEDRGDGPPTMNNGPPIKWRCDRCGHDATYLPQLLSLRQAP